MTRGIRLNYTVVQVGAEVRFAKRNREEWEKMDRVFSLATSLFRGALVYFFTSFACCFLFLKCLPIRFQEVRIEKQPHSEQVGCGPVAQVKHPFEGWDEEVEVSGTGFDGNVLGLHGRLNCFAVVWSFDVHSFIRFFLAHFPSSLP